MQVWAIVKRANANFGYTIRNGDALQACATFERPIANFLYTIRNGEVSQACAIVKNGLDDESISIQTTVLAIGKVAEMETHNSITKDDLIRALRWLFEHDEF